jgi:hypothetical protein
MDLMDVELQIIPGCPHTDGATKLLRQALDDMGQGHVAVKTRVIATDDEAREHAFVGSPTFRVNGRDLFGDHRATPGVCCRLYRTSSGMAPLPEMRALQQMLSRAVEQDLRGPQPAPRT